MSNDQLFDARLSEWLADGRTTSPAWVVQTVVEHARAHPRTAPLGARWSSVMKAVTTRTWPAGALRPLMLALVIVGLLSATGLSYLAWRNNNAVVPPGGSPAPTASTSPSPSPVAYGCPRGSDPDRPGPGDQARPPGEQDWRAAVDAESHVLVLVSQGKIWAFDLCTNIWTTTGSTSLEGGTVAYDAAADLTVILAADRIWTYDADADVVDDAGSTPVVGEWQAVYDPVARQVVARDMRSSRIWTYDAAAGLWQELAQAGDVPPSTDECVPFGDQALSFDSSVDRLVLYVPHSSPGLRPCPAPTAAVAYELDPRSGVWQRTVSHAPSLGHLDWTGPLLQSAYDEHSRLTVMYDGSRLVAYDAQQDSWTTPYETPVDRSTHHNHVRVPIAYDPINERLVMVAGDPLGTAGQVPYGIWSQIEDVTALDLLDMSWTPLLAGRPTSVALDPVGDAVPTQDIGAVSTLVDGATVEVYVTLADEGSYWDVAVGTLARFNWMVDYRPYSGAVGFGPGCNAWTATYRTHVTTTSDGMQILDYIPPTLVLTLPLADLDNPSSLGVSISTHGDAFPDLSEESDYGCHFIPLS